MKVKKWCSRLVHWHCNKSKWYSVFCVAATCLCACLCHPGGVGTTCASSVASSYCTMLPIEMLIQAKWKITSVKSQVSKKSARRDEGGGGVSGLNLANHSFIRGRLIVAPPVHLLFISWTTRRLKLINNLFCYFSDQLNIREVWVIDCTALIKKSSSNFLEQCMHIMAPSKQGHFSSS